ncbi:MAG: hypothetical protein K5643_08800 [Saccharofermentans sp.]|nr:hypothetical protein [Saccharofermentans sp.]
MYYNRGKLLRSLILWSLILIVAAPCTLVCFGVLLTGVSKTSDPAGMFAFFFSGLVINGTLIYFYLRKFNRLSFVTRANRLLEKDEDGYVPLNEFAKEMGLTEEKLINYFEYGMRKGYIVNMNYDSAHRVFLLSDKMTPQRSILMGRPEDRPFIGVHCPGCAASLKIRTSTGGTCPYCGRTIVAPPFQQ